MAASSGKTHKALVMKQIEGKPALSRDHGGPSIEAECSLRIIDVPTPSAEAADKILVRPTHVSLNHRDQFLRQALYPAPSFDTPLLADCVAEIVSGGGSSDGGRVLLNPGHGWLDAPDAPEKPYAILGGTKTNPLGVAQEYVLVDRAETALCPEHLTGEEAAALPLVGLTGWRAFVTRSGAAEEGKSILITGIGGGVATIVLQFAVAKGVRAWVTSSDPAKIERAVALGAQGGVNYRDADWDRQLKTRLPADRPLLDAVIDGAGGDVVDRTVRLLRPGGSIVSYGMTVGPKMQTSMSAVLKHVDIRASTMGSRREFRDMVDFVAARRVRPVVSRTVEGAIDDLERWDGLFDDMKQGRQFGKLVYKISAAGGEPGKNKL